MHNNPGFNLGDIKFKTDATTYAEHLAERLNEISSECEDDERVGITIGFSGQLISLILTNVTAKDTSYVVIECMNENKDKYYFIQSTQQINILVTKIKVTDSTIPRKIGFIV